jgi:hypothetical protein
MQTGRALATLRMLPDDKVQVIGGDSDYSMEIFDSATIGFNAIALMPPTAELVPETLSN